MAAVIHRVEKLTGVYQIRPRLIFGPTIFVEVEVSGFDTNTGYDEETYKIFRKATNEDIPQLKKRIK